MNSRAIVGIAAVAAALGLVLSGCSSYTNKEWARTTAKTCEKTTSSKTVVPSTARVAPRDDDATGPNPTIAGYIKENNIQQAPVKPGEPGSPTIDLPVPKGWEPTGENTPDWAYCAITYTGPEADEYTPSIVAMVSKLTGNVDPQKIIELAPGEINNLPGFEAWNPGGTSTLGDHAASQVGGIWQDEGVTKTTAQKTVVIPADDGLYILQLNADGLKEQADIISDATDVIDVKTNISF